MTVVRFPRHLLSTPARCQCAPGDNCPVCQGGLALCETCGGAEGAMPTDCPQRRMTYDETALVYAGLLDYDHRLGWIDRDAWAHRRSLHRPGPEAS